MNILGIDPGNMETGYAIISMPDFALLEFAKESNEVVLDKCKNGFGKWFDVSAIEMIASYGMPVGKSVFDTCRWIGKFEYFLDCKNHIYRKDEKITLCGSMKAKDSNVRQALIDRFAEFDFKSGKGTKKNPDTFYGVSKDVWSAIAVAVTYYDMYVAKECGNVKNDKK